MSVSHQRLIGLLLIGVIFVSCCFVVFADEATLRTSEDGDEDGDDGAEREPREYMPEAWHAIQTIPEGATGWIPRDPINAAAPSKRRRLRKRKRRPTIASLDQSSESIRQSSQEDSQETKILATKDNEPVRRRKRPNAGDPWEELQEESVRPYVRRKVTPAYDIQEDMNVNALKASIHFGPTSDTEKNSQIPETAPVLYGKPVNEKQDRIDKDEEIALITSTTKNTPKLKDILKQNGGLSLSEILQQKNITLSELLMGKKEAIKALTETSEAIPITDSSIISITPKKLDVNEINKFKRLPPSVTFRKENTNKRYKNRPEIELLSDEETKEAQKKRLSLLQGHNMKNIHNAKFPDVTRYEVVTEATTEKRVFVPSIETTTTTRKPTEVTEKYTTKTSKLSSTKAKLPVTNAKLKNTNTHSLKNEESPSIPLKPYKINIKDVFGLQNQPQEKVSDEPLRMSFDLDTVMDNATKLTTSEPSTTELPPMASANHNTAKDEILEILKDPKGRAGLARILEARNMTVQELIEQRERGSSQLHLADIFHSKTREPEPSDDAFEGKISSEVFTNFPVFSRRPKTLMDDERVTGAPQESTSPKLESEDTENPKESFPWPELHPNIFTGLNQNNKDPILEPANDILTEEDIQRLDDLDQRFYASASNEQLNDVDESPLKVLTISSGVKSAIVASLAVIMLALIVFVTMLLMFKWARKKKKTNLHYTDSLKPPLFAGRSRNVKVFMAETLGRTKINYYKRHLQNMSDESWDKGTTCKKY